MLLAMSSIDQRKSRRESCGVPVDASRDSVFSGCRTVDFSREGLGFVSDEPIDLGAKIHIEIQLNPDDEPVLVLGEVKWVEKIQDKEQYRIGMRLSNTVLFGSQTRLRNYFRRRMASDS